MKKLLAAFLFAVTASACYSQNITDRSPLKPDGSSDAPVFNFSANAEKLVTAIVDVVGLKQNFTIQAAKVLNVEAVIRHGQRYIKYNPEFINSLNKKAKDQWASVFVLAHEIGHHLNGHTVLRKHMSPAIELEADEFAGFVMSRMGATLDQAKLAVIYIANPVTSKTHPGTADRVKAVETGWKRAANK